MPPNLNSQIISQHTHHQPNHTTSRLHCHLQLPLVLLLGHDLSDQLVGGCVALESVGPAGGLEGGVQHAFPQQPLGVKEVSCVFFWSLPQQEVDHLFCEVRQIFPVPLLLDLEVAADVVELRVRVHALQFGTLFGQVRVVPREVLGDVNEVLVRLGGLEVLLLLVQSFALLAVLLVGLAFDLDLVRIAVFNAVQRDLVVEAGAHSAVPLQFFLRFFDDAAVLEQLSPIAGKVHELVAYVEPGLFLHAHGHDLTMEWFQFVTCQLCDCDFLDVLAVVVVLEAGVVCLKGVLLEAADHFIYALLQDVLGSAPADESRLYGQQEPQVLMHLQLQRFCLLNPALFLIAFTPHLESIIIGSHHQATSLVAATSLAVDWAAFLGDCWWFMCVGWWCILAMNFLKSESYSLSPDEYLQKFKNPHQIISTKGDPDNDEKDLADLNLILDKYYNDNGETALTKERIITELTEMVSQWMKDIAKNTKQAEFDFEEHGYGLKVFGSYCLKTNSFDGDIDMVCIVPEFINRERHFFVILTNYFRRHEHIREVYTIPDAIVPLIRLTLYGVQIDLLLSIISRDFMLKNPDFFEVDNNCEINFPSNPQELRSVNGYRTALYLKRKYVEKYKNYRATLKAIKHWAMNKGIYSQIYGYLGGAAFSIMLAKICQLYPNYSALQLLDRFFFIYANWVWSISVIIEKTKSLERPLESEMAILTPLEPHMNAGHYISKITSNITRKHLRSASKLIQEINKGKKTWMDLFAPADFFNDYRNFIEISVMGEKLEDFVPWKGNIESKIRKFIQNLEQHSEISHGLEVNPYPKAFASKHPSFKHCSKYYIGIKCSPSSTINDHFEIDLTQSVRGFLELLENYPEIDKKAPKEINIGFTHITKENIPQDILEAFARSFGPK